ncbi:MAG: peptide chain release factor N(5)-glutamine methyltransferase [Dehalococcoidia bacterium]|nr:peptide chain release factor N(5)-glutamine methyltransferase [Dehalococcoidia bacterium]
MTTLGELLRSTERRLAQAGVEEARLEAELLLMTALSADRATLYANLQDPATHERAGALEALMLRRVKREPTAYITGKREFYGREFHVGPGVFIPRPETETLVEEALRIAATIGGGLTIADIGCGSGAIGITLVAELPRAVAYAIDIDAAALQAARKNVERLATPNRVKVLRGDLLAPLPAPVDIIAANPPYIPSKQIPGLPPEVKSYEPRRALDGGLDGMDLLRRLLTDAPRYLKPGGALLAEIDPEQATEARALAHAAFPGAAVDVARDLAGRERVLTVRTGAASPASG